MIFYHFFLGARVFSLGKDILSITGMGNPVIIKVIFSWEL